METVKRAFCVCLSDPFVMASGGAGWLFHIIIICSSWSVEQERE